MMADVRIVSWNVRGLNHKLKRASIFQYIKQTRPHIILLQETHLDGSRILSFAQTMDSKGNTFNIFHIC